MKKNLFVAAIACFALLQLSAQDSSKIKAASKINTSSEQTDKMGGKKIQQQSLSNHHIESIAATPKDSSTIPKKKVAVKHRRKRS